MMTVSRRSVFATAPLLLALMTSTPAGTNAASASGERVTILAGSGTQRVGLTIGRYDFGHLSALDLTPIQHTFFCEMSLDHL